MAKRLKVFQTTLGFFDTIVAAPSQAEALEAWGVRQNLFAEGAASLVDDPVAVAAAVAVPGLPLKRPVGSTAPFEAEPTALPQIAPPPARPKSAPRTVTNAPPPDRHRLNAAEAKLDRVRNVHGEAQADIDAERRALADRARREAERFARKEADAIAAVDSARRAYRDAGGLD